MICDTESMTHTPPISNSWNDHSYI